MQGKDLRPAACSHSVKQASQAQRHAIDEGWRSEMLVLLVKQVRPLFAQDSSNIQLNRCAYHTQSMSFK